MNADDRVHRDNDDTAPEQSAEHQDTAQAPSAPVARMLANPRRTRRA